VTLKVILDELRCDAHGLCVEACPDVFALDDDDDVVRVVDASPDDALLPSLERAVQLCPKAAIRVER
jgi:ferredoxin